MFQGKNNNILQPNVVPRQGRIVDKAALPIVLEVDRFTEISGCGIPGNSQRCNSTTIADYTVPSIGSRCSKRLNTTRRGNRQAAYPNCCLVYAAKILEDMEPEGHATQITLKIGMDHLLQRTENSRSWLSTRQECISEGLV